jgi:hypothetical protein
MAKAKNAFEEYLDELDEDEYKSSTIDTFKDVGETMLKHGMSPEDVVDCLDSIKGAVANEYGD